MTSDSNVVLGESSGASSSIAGPSSDTGGETVKLWLSLSEDALVSRKGCCEGSVSLCLKLPAFDSMYRYQTASEGKKQYKLLLKP